MYKFELIDPLVEDTVVVMVTILQLKNHFYDVQRGMQNVVYTHKLGCGDSTTHDQVISNAHRLVYCQDTPDRPEFTQMWGSANAGVSFRAVVIDTDASLLYTSPTIADHTTYSVNIAKSSELGYIEMHVDRDQRHFTWLHQNRIIHQYRYNLVGVDKVYRDLHTGNPVHLDEQVGSFSMINIVDQSLNIHCDDTPFYSLLDFATDHKTGYVLMYRGEIRVYDARASRCRSATLCPTPSPPLPENVIDVRLTMIDSNNSAISYNKTSVGKTTICADIVDLRFGRVVSELTPVVTTLDMRSNVPYITII